MGNYAKMRDARNSPK